MNWINGDPSGRMIGTHGEQCCRTTSRQGLIRLEEKMFNAQVRLVGDILMLNIFTL